METKWYAAQLKAGRERIALRGLADNGFSTYYPMMEVSRAARNGRWVDVPEPIFPLYAFLQSAPEIERWRAAKNTRGVVRLLGNGQPCALPDREIDRLKEHERAGLFRHPHRCRIRQGDRVEFRVGSLVGLAGICQWTRRERVGVLLSILGGSNVVIAPRDVLKLAVA